ncbi:MAG: hypothetical protein QOH97_4883 [Actinoplanes sp.]|jgi:hypothetical protein|nr:hypothetical protein [Actinoplanes sp.]
MIQLINVLLIAVGPILVVGALAAVTVAFNPPTHRVHRPVFRIPTIRLVVTL